MGDSCDEASTQSQSHQNGRARRCDTRPGACSRALPFEIFAERNEGGAQETHAIKDSLRRLQEDSDPVTDVFFSVQNVTRLQQALRHGVYLASGSDSIVVGDQSSLELGIIMRSVFLQKYRNNPNNVHEQVARLNTSVLDFCVPQVLREARMYMTYRKSIETLPIPMERSVVASSKGSKQNIFKAF